MATLTLEFSGFKNRPYVEFDEREICVNSLKKCTIDISSGEHKIFVCEKKYVFRWYWWLPLFNIYYMFLLLKQYRGNSLGYDGECVFALFNIICSNENAIVCIKRNEVSWEQTEMAADYTTLTIVSPNDILVKTCELDSKVRFRLKFNNVSPLCLLTLVYNLIFMISVVQNTVPLWEVLLGVGVDFYIVGFTAYRIYKTINEKSYSDLCDISRVIIKQLKNKKNKRHFKT